MRVSTTALAAGLIAILSLSWADDPPVERTSLSDLQRHRSSRLIGMEVEGLDGTALGHIKDFVVDVQNGEVKYAVVGIKGPFRLRPQTKAVPAWALSIATSKRDTLAVNINEPGWDRVPPFRKSDLATLNQPAKARQLAQWFKISPGDSPPQTQPGSVRPERMTVAEPNRDRPSTGALHLASDLIGRDVVNRQRQNVGEVNDLLIDFSDKRPDFVIISAERLLSREATFATQLRSIQLSPRGKVSIDANRQRFEQAQSFHTSKWFSQSAAVSGALFRYDDQVDLARDRHRPPKRPNLKQDRQVSRRVRDAVSQNGGLSTPSRNVSIYTVGGEVTLQGYVPTAEQRAQIERVAAQIAGVENVNNQIQIKAQ